MEKLIRYESKINDWVNDWRVNNLNILRKSYWKRMSPNSVYHVALRNQKCPNDLFLFKTIVLYVVNILQEHQWNLDHQIIHKQVVWNRQVGIIYQINHLQKRILLIGFKRNLIMSVRKILKSRNIILINLLKISFLSLKNFLEIVLVLLNLKDQEMILITDKKTFRIKEWFLIKIHTLMFRSCLNIVRVVRKVLIRRQGHKIIQLIILIES